MGKIKLLILGLSIPFLMNAEEAVVECKEVIEKPTYLNFAAEMRESPWFNRPWYERWLTGGYITADGNISQKNATVNFGMRRTIATISVFLTPSQLLNKIAVDLKTSYSDRKSRCRGAILYYFVPNAYVGAGVEADGYSWLNPFGYSAQFELSSNNKTFEGIIGYTFRNEHNHFHPFIEVSVSKPDHRPAEFKLGTGIIY